MATKKKPGERRNEILDTAEKIFITKGYEETSVEDILKVLQLSKGGFYYYFESKEEVLDSIIRRYTDQIVKAAQMVVDNTKMNAQEKFIQMLGAIKLSNEESDEMLTQLHRPNNRTMHLKSLLETVNALAPIFGRIARQGMEEGIFTMDYPEEIMEALCMTASIWFDEAFFDLTKEEKMKRAAAFIEMAEKCVGVTKNTFGQLRERFS